MRGRTEPRRVTEPFPETFRPMSFTTAAVTPDLGWVKLVCGVETSVVNLQTRYHGLGTVR